MESKQIQHSVVDVTGDGSKIWCCKEQYCLGTWNIRSMNEGKLEVVKQEMTRVNIDILGIRELRWTGMGEFNSDDHYIYYCGQESLRRNGVATMVNKRVQNSVLGCSLKNDRMISVHFQGKPFSSVQFSSVTQSCLTLCNPMNRSMPGLAVHHQLPESTQTHVHWVGDAIQPSHPLSSPSPPALNLSQHQDLFQWVSSLHQVAKVLEFQLQHQSFQWTPRTDLH